MMMMMRANWKREKDRGRGHSNATSSNFLLKRSSDSPLGDRFDLELSRFGSCSFLHAAFVVAHHLASWSNDHDDLRTPCA